MSALLKLLPATLILITACDGKRERLEPPTRTDSGLLDASIPDKTDATDFDASPIDASTFPDAGVTADTGETDTGSTDTTAAGCTDDPGFTLEHIATSFEGAQILDESHDTIIGIPRHFDDSLRAFSGVRLRDDGQDTVSMPVSGNVPFIQVIHASYDRAADRTVILAYGQDQPGQIAPRLELVTITLDAGLAATVQRLAPTNPPDIHGLSFSWIYPEGDGVHYRAFRFSGKSVRATVQGTTVSWGSEVELTEEGFFDSNYITHDPANNRLLAFGETVIEGVPPDFTERFVPSVFEINLAGGAVWSKIQAFGEAPPEIADVLGGVESTFFYDEDGTRLLVFMNHEIDDPIFGPMLVTGVWALSDTGSWQLINPDHGSCCVYSYQGVVDPVRRRSIVVTGSGLRGTELSPGVEGNDFLSTGVIIPAPRPQALVFDNQNGRLFANTTAGPVTMDVRSGDLTWQAVFTQEVHRPHQASERYGLVFDPPRNRLLSVGGGTYSTTTNAVYELDLLATQPVWNEVQTSGPSPGGHVEMAIVHDTTTETAFVVCGQRQETSLVDSAQIAALDLATMTWRTVADLPLGRRRPFARLDGPDHLQVLMGISQSNGLTDGYRVAISNGTITPLVLTGDVPDVGAGGASAVALGAQLVITAFGQKRYDLFDIAANGTTLTFTKKSTCRDPRSAWTSFGVADPTATTGYLMGSNLWRLAK